MLQPSSLLQLAGADRKFAVTPEPGAKPAAVQPLPAPLGHAAEGWKVSLVFRGEPSHSMKQISHPCRASQVVVKHKTVLLESR